VSKISLGNDEKPVEEALTIGCSYMVNDKPRIETAVLGIRRVLQYRISDWNLLWLPLRWNFHKFIGYTELFFGELIMMKRENMTPTPQNFTIPKRIEMIPFGSVI
jgi:hypothetical protein